MENEIIRIVKYFAYFQYAPSFDDIYKFLPVKVKRKDLKIVLNNMVIAQLLHGSTCPPLPTASGVGRRVAIKTMEPNQTRWNNCSLYTLPQYTKFIKKRIDRRLISQKKLLKINLFIKILSLIPQIKFVGLSGTLAMANAKKDDDIDLFIITGRNRLWLGRFITIILAELFFLRRRRKANSAKKDKVCLNLFFDASDLRIPSFKQTEYVAHEVLQTKPLINKDQTYEYFLKSNGWVKKFFPIGVPRLRRIPTGVFALFPIFNLLENLLKKLQLNIIKQHQTNEIVTDTQLWFFPKDFEQKLKERMK